VTLFHQREEFMVCFLILPEIAGVDPTDDSARGDNDGLWDSRDAIGPPKSPLRKSDDIEPQITALSPGSRLFERVSRNR
jgi:hypothetical protein